MEFPPIKGFTDLLLTRGKRQHSLESLHARGCGRSGKVSHRNATMSRLATLGPQKIAFRFASQWARRATLQAPVESALGNDLPHAAGKCGGARYRLRDPLVR
jgi:hypothetical protein